MIDCDLYDAGPKRSDSATGEHRDRPWSRLPRQPTDHAANAPRTNLTHSSPSSANHRFASLPPQSPPPPLSASPSPPASPSSPPPPPPSPTLHHWLAGLVPIFCAPSGCVCCRVASGFAFKRLRITAEVDSATAEVLVTRACSAPQTPPVPNPGHSRTRRHCFHCAVDAKVSVCLACHRRSQWPGDIDHALAYADRAREDGLSTVDVEGVRHVTCLARALRATFLCNVRRNARIIIKLNHADKSQWGCD